MTHSGKPGTRTRPARGTLGAMDEKDLLAALAAADARRRRSVTTLIVVNGLLVLGLAIFFLLRL